MNIHIYVQRSVLFLVFLPNYLKLYDKQHTWCNLMSGVGRRVEYMQILIPKEKKRIFMLDIGVIIK